MHSSVYSPGIPWCGDKLTFVHACRQYVIPNWPIKMVKEVTPLRRMGEDVSDNEGAGRCCSVRVGKGGFNSASVRGMSSMQMH